MDKIYDNKHFVPPPHPQHSHPPLPSSSQLPTCRSLKLLSLQALQAADSRSKDPPHSDPHEKQAADTSFFQENQEEEGKPPAKKEETGSLRGGSKERGTGSERSKV